MANRFEYEGKIRFSAEEGGFATSCVDLIDMPERVPIGGVYSSVPNLVEVIAELFDKGGTEEFEPEEIVRIVVEKKLSRSITVTVHPGPPQSPAIVPVVAPCQRCGYGC